MNVIGRLLATVVLLALSYLIIVILFNMATYYKPNDVEQLSSGGHEVVNKTSFTLMTWNIGYCGLGADSDFFFDGGQQVRSPKSSVLQNLSSIKSILSEHAVDFQLLQEVDKHSKRSYYLNEVDSLKSKQFADFAKNYDVQFVPLKWTNPMGRVVSGLLSQSDIQPKQSYRIQLPGSYPFPDKYFFLRRCLLVQEFQLPNDKKLNIVNLHLSAFNDDLLKQELEFIKGWIKNQDLSCNYFILGGDWNCTPQSELISSLFESWNLAYDETHNTNRSVDAPLNDETQFQTIDFFLCSPNITIDSVQTIDKRFEYSDHQPVLLSVHLAN